MNGSENRVKPIWLEPACSPLPSSKRVSAMAHKANTLKFVVLTVLAVALGIMISVGVVHLKDRHPVAIDREANAELPNAQLSRVHLLLSSMR